MADLVDDESLTAALVLLGQLVHDLPEILE